ncbi:hypothetical protein GS399_15840, partial [Pedobacter sp. HMF7647]
MRKSLLVILKYRILSINKFFGINRNLSTRFSTALVKKAFLLFFIALSFCKSYGQSGITEIYTDYKGYWASGSGTTGNLATSSVKPDNDHNVLAFKWNGTIYSTGVNDATLTSKGVTFTPMRFQAFPVRNYALDAGSLPGVGAMKDGTLSVAVTPPYFSIPANVSDFLTDGINGLNIGTGIANVKAGTLTFDFGGIITPAQINDGIPDIIVSQVAQPDATLDSVYFTDGSGALVGNRVAINHTLSPSVGNWMIDFYRATDGAVQYTNTERPIRIWAADLSAFGITSANYTPALILKYKLNGSSDPAFLAFNDQAIQVVSANDDNASTAINTSTSIDVLANDKPSAALKVSSVTVTIAPLHGTTSVNSSTGAITYTPTAGYYGTDQFTYSVCNNNTSNPQCDDAKVSINVGPDVATPVFTSGSSSSRCQGSGTVTYSATANNSTSISYSLTPTTAGTINSSTGLVTWAAGFSGIATITAVATGVNGPKSAAHTVTVYAPPVLSSAAAVSVCNNTALGYTATSSTSGTTFSWTRAAVTGISNAASSGNGAGINETLINTTGSPVDVTYVVMLTANSCPNTQNVVVTVGAANIIAAPTTTTFCITSSPTNINLTGSNISGATYQWQINTDPYNFGTNGAYSDISGATSKDYDPGVITQSTAYRRKVTSGCISTSDYVAFYVTPTVTGNSITAQGSTTTCGSFTNKYIDGTYPSGGNNNTHTFQWQSSADGTNFTNIAGATSQQYTAATINTSTYFRRLTISGYCTYPSNTVYYNTNGAETPGSIWGNSSFCAPASNQSYGVAAVSGATSYTWNYSGSGATFTSTTNSVSINFAANATSGTLSVIANTPCGSSSASTLAITLQNPVITQQPTDQNICQSNSFTNTVAATGSGLSYQWQYSDDGGASWKNINDDPGSGFYPKVVGSTTATINITNIPSAYLGFRGRVQITSNTCPTNSNEFVLVVRQNSTLTLTAGSASTSACLNTAVTPVKYTVGGGGTGASITAGSLPTGMTGTFAGNVFTISGTPTSTGTFNYTVTTSGPCTNVSLSGTITVSSASVGGSVSANATVCTGTNSGTLTLSGQTGNVIRWESSPDGTTWSAITNTTTSLTYTNLTTTTRYRAVVQSGGCTSANSTTAIITVNPNTTITLSSASVNDTKCINTAITPITFNTTNATDATITTGTLPTGVTLAFNSGTGVVTLSGTPTVSGSFPYTVTATGGCASGRASGTI